MKMHLQINIKLLLIVTCVMVTTVKSRALLGMQIYEIDSNGLEGSVKDYLSTSLFIPIKKGCDDKSCETTCQALGFLHGKCVTKHTCRCSN